jgi:hypothetical protein
LSKVSQISPQMGKQMKIHHRSGQVVYRYLDDAVALFVEHLGFEHVLAQDGFAFVRQPGSNVDIQLLAGSSSITPQGNKTHSHIAFISDRPAEEREAMRLWCEGRGLATEQGQWSDRELWIDLPDVFLDFAIEIAHPSLLVELDYKFIDG